MSSEGEEGMIEDGRGTTSSTGREVNDYFERETFLGRGPDEEDSSSSASSFEFSSSSSSHYYRRDKGYGKGEKEN